MNCEHCGKSINPISRYCEYCGLPTDPFYVRSKNELLNRIRTVKRFSKKNKWFLPMCLVLVLLITVSIVLDLYKKPVDFMDFVVIDVEGYDGSGSLDVSIDYNKFAEAVLGKAPDSTKDIDKYEEYIKYRNLLKDLISVKVDRNNNLSNGENIVVTVTVEHAAIFDVRKIAISQDGKYTKTIEIGVDTQPLMELVAINPLDYIKMEFTGSNRYGNADISFDEFEIDVTSSNGEQYTLTFAYHTSWGTPYFEVHSSSITYEYAVIYVEISKDYGLSNGDMITLTLIPDNEQLSEYFGVTIVTTEKTYIVTGLK